MFIYRHCGFLATWFRGPVVLMSVQTATDQSVLVARCSPRMASFCSVHSAVVTGNSQDKLRAALISTFRPFFGMAKLVMNFPINKVKNNET